MDLERLLKEYGDEEMCNEPFEQTNTNLFDEKIVDLIQHQIENGLTMQCTVKLQNY